MEPSQRGALNLVRLVAICIIFAGIIDAGMYLTQYETPYYQMRHHESSQQPMPLNIWRLVMDSIPLITGILILIKARGVAEWLADLIE